MNKPENSALNLEFEVDRSNPLPLYSQLAQALQDSITGGIFPNGSRLPSEAELMAACKVSRMTVRSALDHLESSGFIQRMQGKGTFVSYTGAQHTHAGDIDVLLDVSYAYFSTHYIKSISQVLTRENYQFIIHDTRDSQEDICAILHRIAAVGSAGVIIQPSHRFQAILPELLHALEALDARGIPYIMLDRGIEGVHSPQVTFDDEKGAATAADYLCTLGHKSIAMITCSEYCENEIRLRGLNRVLSARGLPEAFTAEHDRHLDTVLPELIRKQNVTAIFCYNDEVALTVMRILRMEHIHVPEDVSVIGYDDTILATGTIPQLTSVIHPKEILGQLAAEKLLSMIEHTTYRTPLPLLEPRLHLRSSCGPRKKG